MKNKNKKYPHMLMTEKNLYRKKLSTYVAFFTPHAVRTQKRPKYVPKTNKYRSLKQTRLWENFHTTKDTRVKLTLKLKRKRRGCKISIGAQHTKFLVELYFSLNLIIRTRRLWCARQQIKWSRLYVMVIFDSLLIHFAFARRGIQAVEAR